MLISTLKVLPRSGRPKVHLSVWSILLLAAVALPGEAAAKGKARIRLFHVSQHIDGSGHLSHTAKLNTRGLSPLRFRFRVKIELGRKGRRGRKKMTPESQVKQITVFLVGRPMGTVKGQPGLRWSKIAVYLRPGEDPNGSRLEVEARGKPGGLVRVWVDAYPRKKPLSMPLPASGSGGTVIAPPISGATRARANKRFSGTWALDAKATLAGASSKERKQVKLLTALMAKSSITFSAGGTYISKGESHAFSMTTAGGGSASSSAAMGSVKGRWMVLGAKGDTVKLELIERADSKNLFMITFQGEDKAYVAFNKRRFYFSRRK
jgi:hypothetical protein